MIQIGSKKNSYTSDVHIDTPTLVYNIEQTHIQCTYICNGHMCVQNIATYILKKLVNYNITGPERLKHKNIYIKWYHCKFSILPWTIMTDSSVSSRIKPFSLQHMNEQWWPYRFTLHYKVLFSSDVIAYTCL